jgi:glycine/D-amino acid oxidase-like deaminating enzyme
MRATFREGIAVEEISREKETKVALLLSTGEKLQVDRVVVAPGPWLGARAWRSLLGPLGVRTKKVVAFHIDIPPRPSDSIALFLQEDAFLLPLKHRGHWLFSYTCQEWNVDPDTVTTGISESNSSEAREILLRYAPKLADLCKSGRVFCDAYSITGEPLVRALDDEARVIFAGAANGSGYRLAPAIASEVVALLQRRDSPRGTCSC